MNFSQFLLILNARKKIVLGILFTSVAVTILVSLWLPKEFTATATLIVDAKSKDPLTGQLLPSQMFPGYMATQVDIINSSRVASQVVRQLGLAENPGARQQFMEDTKGKGTIDQWMGDLLLKRLEVEPSRESNTIALNFSGADPQFAAIVANAFAKVYIETGLDLRLVPARQNAEWFDQQIVQLRSKLDGAQQKLTAYQRENGLVESEERMDVETRRLSDLAGQVVGAQSLAFDASSRTRDSANLPEVTNNPVVQGLKAQVTLGDARLADLAKRVGENHPDFRRVQAEVGTYKSKLASELKTATRGVSATSGVARQRVADLKEALEEQKTKVLGLKQQREKAALLARDVANAQLIYDSALQRYAQSSMEAQSIQTDIAVLNPAVAPIKHSRPRRLLNVVLSIVFGSLLGVGIGFLVELLDRRVRSGQDIVELDIPLLAEVNTKRRRPEKMPRFFTRRRLTAA